MQELVLLLILSFNATLFVAIAILAYLMRKRGPNDE